MKLVIAEPVKEIFSKHQDLSPIVLQLLYNRGIKDREEMEKFLNPDYIHDLHDPFLFIDMSKAIDRINTALNNQEKILIYGDYDSDGICSSVIIATALDQLKFVNYEVYLPHREKEGYGLNQEAVADIIASKATLVITLDCGITNCEEITRLNQAKIDTIIIDHHVVGPEVPSAYAIINPKRPEETYPYKDLATVGLAFKFVSALLTKSTLPKQAIDTSLKWLLDLVAVATVTDMVPLLGENRIMLKYGLIVLNKTRRTGFKYLIDSINNFKNETKIITEHEIGFQIGPRINAASRMGHAMVAYNLLIANNHETATLLTAELNEHNKNRQEFVSEVLSSVIDQINKSGVNQKVIVVFDEKCTAGIAGIIASKIVDKYARPAIVVGKSAKGYVGSGRSVDGFHITNIINQLNSEMDNKLFLKCGGHAKACGFTLNSIDDLDILRTGINKIADAVLKNHVFNKQINVDAIIDLNDIDLSLYKELKKFEPHGAANPKPKFLSKGVMVSSISKVGAMGKHLRLSVCSLLSNANYKCISFGLGQYADEITVGDKVDIVFEIELDKWNGYTGIQLVLDEIIKN